MQQYIYTVSPQTFELSVWYYITPIIVLIITGICLWGVFECKKDQSSIDNQIGFILCCFLSGIGVFVLFASIVELNRAIKHSVHHYENKQVVGTLNSRYNHTYESKSSQTIPYIEYVVEGNHIIIQMEPGRPYPEKAYFYRNIKFRG